MNNFWAQSVHYTEVLLYWVGVAAIECINVGTVCIAEFHGVLVHLYLFTLPNINNSVRSHIRGVQIRDG